MNIAPEYTDAESRPGPIEEAALLECSRIRLAEARKKRIQELEAKLVGMKVALEHARKRAEEAEDEADELSERLSESNAELADARDQHREDLGIKVSLQQRLDEAFRWLRQMKAAMPVRMADLVESDSNASEDPSERTMTR